MAREIEIMHVSGKQDTIVSYLPLSHIAAQLTDIWIPIKIGGLTFFAQPDALRVRLSEVLTEHPGAVAGTGIPCPLDGPKLFRILFSPSSFSVQFHSIENS